jgi:hypothetical protein
VRVEAKVQLALQAGRILAPLRRVTWGCVPEDWLFVRLARERLVRCGQHPEIPAQLDAAIQDAADAWECAPAPPDALGRR